MLLSNFCDKFQQKCWIVLHERVISPFTIYSSRTECGYDSVLDYTNAGVGSQRVVIDQTEILEET